MNNLSIVLATRSGVIHFTDLANALAYLNNNAQNMETSLYVMGDEKELFDPFFLFSFQFSPKNSVHFKDWLELATDIAASTPEMQVHIYPAATSLSERHSSLSVEGYRSPTRLPYSINEKGFAEILKATNSSLKI